MSVSKAAVVLRMAMEDLGLTYRDLGQAIGISHVHCWRVLTGVKTLRAEIMEAMADVLGVDMEDLVEPEPTITVRMPERFVEWMQARAADTQTDMETIVINAVAAWIKADVNSVKLQSHENAKVMKKRGGPKKNG